MKTSIITFLVILLIGCLMQFCADVYSPSIPAISYQLHASMDLVQFSMPLYMFGVAASLLFYGPLSEGYGRKLPVMGGLMILIVGSGICLRAPSIHLLLVGRFIQGIGAGAGGGLWRAIFRDVYKGKELAKYSSYFSMAVMFIIPTAPLIGGYLQHYFDWRSVFVFIILYTVSALALVFFGFKETSQHHHLERLKPSYIFQTFGRLFTNRTFVSITLCSLVTYGGLFSWFVVGPVLLIHLLHLTPIYFGWLCFFGAAAGFVCAGYLNARLVERFGMAVMLRVGWSLMIFSGLLMLIGYQLWGMNLWAIFLPTILLYLGTAFIWPNAFATAMTPFGDIAGYAGTMYSFMQLGGGALITGFVAHVPDTSPLPLAGVFILCAVLALLIHEIFVPKAND